jgi:hypothetical protein
MIVLSAPFDHKHRLTTAVLCTFRLHGYILANLYPFSILRSFRSSHKRCVKFCNMLIFEVRNFYPLVQLASFRISPCRLPRLLVRSTRCYAPRRIEGGEFDYLSDCQISSKIQPDACCTVDRCRGGSRMQ